MLPTDTEEAYNDWGGRSFYSDPPAAVVSFARPRSLSLFGIYAGAVQLLRWLEREGDCLCGRERFGHPRQPRSSLLVPRRRDSRPQRVLDARDADGRGAVHRRPGVRDLPLGKHLLVANPRRGGRSGTPSRLLQVRCLERSVPVARAGPRDNPLGRAARVGSSHALSRSLLARGRNGQLVDILSVARAPTIGWRDTEGIASSAPPTGRSRGPDSPMETHLGAGRRSWATRSMARRIEWSEGRPTILPGGGTPEEFAVLGMAPCWNQYRPDSTGVALMGIIDRGDVVRLELRDDRLVLGAGRRSGRAAHHDEPDRSPSQRSAAPPRAPEDPGLSQSGARLGHHRLRGRISVFGRRCDLSRRSPGRESAGLRSRRRPRPRDLELP